MGYFFFDLQLRPRPQPQSTSLVVAILTMRHTQYARASPIMAATRIFCVIAYMRFLLKFYGKYSEK